MCFDWPVIGVYCRPRPVSSLMPVQISCGSRPSPPYSDRRHQIRRVWAKRCFSRLFSLYNGVPIMAETTLLFLSQARRSRVPYIGPWCGWFLPISCGLFGSALSGESLPVFHNYPALGIKSPVFPLAHRAAFLPGLLLLRRDS